jgi:hypothetical protein
MLNIKFIQQAAGLMRAAVDEARAGGMIVNTKWRELNGDLYLKIPDEEIEPWLELLEDLVLDVNAEYGAMIKAIKNLRDETCFKKISEGERKGEEHGDGAERGAAGVAAGESSGGGD